MGWASFALGAIVGGLLATLVGWCAIRSNPRDDRP